MELSYSKQEDGSKIEMMIQGRLDTNTAPEFDAFLKANLAGKTNFILNCEKLDYISSAGLRVILSAQKIMNEQGSMKLIHVSEMVSEIFEATGFNDILTVER